MVCFSGLVADNDLFFWVSGSQWSVFFWVSGRQWSVFSGLMADNGPSGLGSTDSDAFILTIASEGILSPATDVPLA